VKFLDYLISALLSLSRLESKNIKTKNENIWEMVIKSFHEIETVFSSKWIKSSLKIEDDVHKRIDKNLFAIIINNLIFNAFKFTDSGKITITLNKQFLEVKDSGIGINPENITKIWTRHYREENVWNSNGHGLWLSLVKEIIDKHHFRIDVQSEVWVWSTFRIYF
jgi:signal transduction histidine kinase